MTFGLRTSGVQAHPPAPGRSPRVIVVNPLGMALSHYTAAVVQHLADAGIESEQLSVLEPSQSGKSRLHWLAAYSRLLASAGRRSRKAHAAEKVLLTWPVLGFLDLLMVKALCGGSGIVVYHDPRPLVRSVGSSRAVARAVRLVRNRPATVVHSKEAAQAMADMGLGDGLTVLPHPMLAAPAAAEAPVSGNGADGRPHVRVLGQYKADRDVGLLEALAGRLGAKYQLEVVGRGWPEIGGWNVDPRFVSEAELDELIATSGAILIPYKRFYQSGIAVRALERAVPIVGRAGTSLQELYGPRSRLLVQDGLHVQDGPGLGGQESEVDAWAAAIEYALDHGKAEAARAAKRFHDEAAQGWASLGGGKPPQ
ncbi:hypothetical protein [Arthrobacter sp. C152]